MFFGVVLLGSALKLAKAGDDDGVEPDKNPIVKYVSNHFPVHNQYDGGRFLTRQRNVAGKMVWMLTPLAIVLIAIEATDLMFATDSIPAIFAVSNDPFILYSSNICAILGLRALYFMLEKGMQELHYLKKALVFVLGFIGVKLVIDPVFHFPIAWALGVVLVTITGAVIASLVFRPKAQEAGAESETNKG
jgi:tellurite resistance protein TerC